MGKSEEIKRTDGRKYNKRLAPKPISTKDKMVKPAKTTKSKKQRVSSYAISAMKEEFGSEKEFFRFLAKESRKNFNALKLFMAYSYGKEPDSIDGGNQGVSKKAPQITFNVTNNQQKEDIIDIPHKED